MEKYQYVARFQLDLNIMEVQIIRSVVRILGVSLITDKWNNVKSMITLSIFGKHVPISVENT